jgi:hypothetical protein
MRAQRVELERQAVAAAQEQARGRVRELDEEMGRLAQPGPGLAARQAQILDLALIKTDFLRRMSDLDARAAANELAAGAERTGLGLTFEVVDEDIDGFGLPVSWRGIAFLAFILTAVILPMCVLVVGAFDRRVYSRDDLIQAGFPVLGVLPHFQGDSVGSHAERIRRRRRNRL